jgi:cell pole-organizing protein PopZ
MISSDGTIVKVKNGQDESGKPIGSETNLTDFLRLAQEKGKETEVASSENSAKQVAEQKSTNGQSSTIAIDEIIREVSGPIIKDWLDKNLLGIVKEVVAVEIRNMMSQK